MLNDTKFISPYIFNITSTSDLTIRNFNVLGAMQFISSEIFTTDGDHFMDSVSVRSGTADITFKEMLCFFKSASYSVGITYVQSSVAGQIEEPIYLSNGIEGKQKLLRPTIDPYKEHPDIVALKSPYTIDGNTKLIISALYPQTSLWLHFYPESVLNLARSLSGRLVQKPFWNPVNTFKK